MTNSMCLFCVADTYLYSPTLTVELSLRGLLHVFTFWSLFLIEACGHQVAAMTSEAKQQRHALDKRVSKIAGYGISV